MSKTRKHPELAAALNAMTRAENHIKAGRPDKAKRALARGKARIAWWRAQPR
jgi:hypothetical protein